MSSIYMLLLVGALLQALVPFAVGSYSSINLFSHGPSAGDTTLTPGDDTFKQITVPSFRFLGNSYTSLYIDVNGAVTFGNGLPVYTPTCGPSSHAMIAPYWADADTRSAGNVTYRKIIGLPLFDLELLSLTTDVLTKFGLVYVPSITMVVTWDKVPYFNEGCSPQVIPSLRNTFQLVITSDGTHSFAEFLYKNITWTTGTASCGNCLTGLGVSEAQAGFDAGDGSIYYTLPSSCTAGMLDLPSNSNFQSNTPGKWMFRIDTSYQQACPNSNNPISTILAIFANILTGGAYTC